MLLDLSTCSLRPRFSIPLCTAHTERYVLVRQVTGTWIARYRAVLPKSAVGGRLREKSTVGGRLREKKGRRRRRGKQERRKNTSRRPLQRVVAALVCGSPVSRVAALIAGVEVSMFVLPGGKSLYRAVHTGPPANRYADRSISTVVGRFQVVSAEGGRKKKRRTWISSRVARSVFCGRFILPAWGEETSPCGENERGDQSSVCRYRPVDNP
ncbi:hypothetical protein GW17_00025244 [Ensete ventricosum]|nr:hypothetical protein GW17_00025244 [Ensete ventricosum]